MPEWSKGADLRSASESCVGSNPTLGICPGNDIKLNPARITQLVRVSVL